MNLRISNCSIRLFNGLLLNKVAIKYCNRVLNHLYSPVQNCLDIKKGEETHWLVGENLKKHHKWPYTMKCMHKWSYDFLFNINYILNKIIKRREEKETVMLLWTHNSKWLLNCSHVLHLRCKFDNCDKRKTSLKLFWVLQTNTSFNQIESSVNWERVQYKNYILHSITYLCFRHWPIRNKILCWLYYELENSFLYHCTIPGLSPWGDARGKNWKYRLMLRVLCLRLVMAWVPVIESVGRLSSLLLRHLANFIPSDLRSTYLLRKILPWGLVENNRIVMAPRKGFALFLILASSTHPGTCSR